MSHNPIELKEGAYFIGDAHYSHSRPELFDFIQKIHSKELQPTQLILFGDIFDALFGSISPTLKNNQKMIAMLQEISQDIELIYLEGNHDFNLKKIFPQAKVFPIAQQPVLCTYEGKKIYIAHGDFGEEFGYQLYTAIIRNRFLLPLFNVINFFLRNLVLNKLDAYLSKKDDCNEFNGFREYISKRLEKKYHCDYFVEGHFHQNKIINFNNFIYINLAAFACNQRYFIVESIKNKKFLREDNFHKET